MALLAGHVEFDESGDAVGDGMAIDIYAELVAHHDEDTGAPMPSHPRGRARILSQYAALANRVAAAVVAHIKANGVATVTCVGCFGGDKECPVT
jgi:hypothetical protein